MAALIPLLYVLAVVAANLTAATWLRFGPAQLSVGVLLFGAVLTLRDRMHDRGRGFVYSVIGAALAASAVANLVTGTPMRIVLASAIGLAISEALDTESFEAWRGHAWWKRALFSNALSAPTDTLLFTLIAFAGAMPWDELTRVVVTETAVKYGIAALMVPVLMRRRAGAAA